MDPPRYSSRARGLMATKAEVDRSVAALNDLLGDARGDYSTSRGQTLGDVRMLETRRSTLEKALSENQVLDLEATDRLGELDYHNDRLSSTLGQIKREEDQFAAALRDLGNTRQTANATLKDVSANENAAADRLHTLGAEKRRLLKRLGELEAEEAALSATFGNLQSRRLNLTSDVGSIDNDAALLESGLRDLAAKRREVTIALGAVHDEQDAYKNRLDVVEAERDDLEAELDSVTRSISTNRTLLLSSRRGGFRSDLATNRSGRPPVTTDLAATSGVQLRDHVAASAVAPSAPPASGDDGDQGETAALEGGAETQDRALHSYVKERSAGFPRTTYQLDYTPRVRNYGNYY